ncbi:MAG: tetratricopeptide repeat protein [Lewinella sp.]|nr:tetratricopeptide repeat protein [Lewinella sp.]
MKFLGGLCLLMISLWACSAPADPATSLAELKVLHERLRSLGADAPPGTVEATVDTLLTASEDFVRAFPRDTAAAHILFRAANVAHGAGRFEQAIDLWDRVVDDYPQYAQRPDALFLQGFTADKDLLEADRATRYYEAFLQQFPEHPMAKDVALLLQMLHRNQRPEDLIRSFPAPPDTTEAGLE